MCSCGRLGMVTDFEFRLHPARTYVRAGAVFWSTKTPLRFLRFHLDWIVDCPDELMTSPCSAGHPRCPNLAGELAIAVPACQPGMRLAHRRLAWAGGSVRWIGRLGLVPRWWPNHGVHGRPQWF